MNRAHFKMAIALCCAMVMVAVAADTGLEGTWNTDGVAVFEAAKKEKKSLSGLPEATQIKFKADTKKNKLTGTVKSLIDDKEYEVVDGKLDGNKFSFGTVPSSAIGFDTGGNGNRGGFNNNNNNQSQPKPILWKGELKDADTISLQRVDESGNPIKTSDGAVMGALLLHRAKK